MEKKQVKKLFILFTVFEDMISAKEEEVNQLIIDLYYLKLNRLEKDTEAIRVTTIKLNYERTFLDILKQCRQMIIKVINEISNQDRIIGDILKVKFIGGITPDKKVLDLVIVRNGIAISEEDYKQKLNKGLEICANLISKNGNLAKTAREFVEMEEQFPGEVQ